MILAEENVVLSKVNADLSARMQELHGRQRNQTNILGGLLTTTDFGLHSTVLNDALQNGQALLGLLDLPRTYIRPIGRFENPSRKARERRSDLIDSIERQLVKSSVRKRSQRY
jgi:hypothetical protein